MILRLVAICVIYLGSSIAWAVLGTTIFARTNSTGDRLAQSVSSTWGGPQVQRPPEITRSYTVPETVAETVDGVQRTRTENRVVTVARPIENSRIEVNFDLEPRQKGLLWYSTYTSRFRAAYTFSSDAGQSEMFDVRLPYPSQNAVYDDVQFSWNGEPLTVENSNGEAHAAVPLDPGGSGRLEISFRSQGLDDWRYVFADGVSQVSDFELTMRTNFDQVDFPDDTLSPTNKEPAADGWLLTWSYRNVVSGYPIALRMPEKLQPGPLAGRISYFGPVSLLFFFFVLFLITTLRGASLHPMNYFFLAAAFFAFHLLLAYLVDHISIHAAFVISSVVSVSLVASYLRLVAGSQFAFREAAGAQALYLVLFSYAFFFEGYTGLTVTIGAVVTLFICMQVTARVDWNEVFSGRGLAQPPPPAGQTVSS